MTLEVDLAYRDNLSCPIQETYGHTLGKGPIKLLNDNCLNFYCKYIGAWVNLNDVADNGGNHTMVK